VAGHKLYAPKGVGALYVRSGVFLEKLIHGAGHEMNRRAGTENVLEIVGLGEACAMIDEDLPRHAAHMTEMRDRLELGIRARVSDIRVHGHPEKRLPNTLSVGFRGLEAGRFLSRLESVAASAGAACHGHDVHVSHVLEAMGVPLEFAMGTVRFSVGRFTTREEIDGAVTDVANAAEELRRG
jgi:cysteine desulfurase